MRPGRLDRILYVGPPDQKAREEILKIRTRTMSVEPGLDVAEIARIVRIFVSSLVWMSAERSDVHLYWYLQTQGCSGAEITALCQEAALLTMQKDMQAQHVCTLAFLIGGCVMQTGFNRYHSRLSSLRRTP